MLSVYNVLQSIMKKVQILHRYKQILFSICTLLSSFNVFKLSLCCVLLFSSAIFPHCTRIPIAIYIMDFVLYSTDDGEARSLSISHSELTVIEKKSKKFSDFQIDLTMIFTRILLHFSALFFSFLSPKANVLYGFKAF